MKKDFKTLLTIFTSSFYISAFTFGGGFVIVPLMQKKFVNDLKWIEEKEMYDLLAIAQSSPGAIAINTSALIGFKIAGFLGAAAAVLGTILPPLVIISVIALFYNSFKENKVISAALKGMQAGVAAVIINAALSSGIKIIKQKSVFSAVIMTASFICVFFLNINVFLIIIASAFFGFLLFYITKVKEAKKL